MGTRYSRRVALLEVNELQTSYSMRDTVVAAVDGVSFSIDAGECLGVVGESGCGKSTIGMSIMRLLAANGSVSKGSILLDGRDLVTLSERQMQGVRGNDIALIPQDPMTSLNPVMRIGRQIAEGVMIHRKASKAEAYARAIEVLKMVQMPNPEQRMDQYPFQLSGGLRQRVMIAMALVCEPKLLIADEPTTALDVTIQAQILDVLDGLRSEFGMATMLITHDMGVIAGRTDRVVVMYAGRKIEEGATRAVFEEMRHPYTRALLAAVPKVDGATSERLLSIPGLPPDLSKPISGCRFAPRCTSVTDHCRTAEPSLNSDADDGHYYACFNPGRGPVAVTVRSSVAEQTAAPAPVAMAEPLLHVVELTKEFPLKSNKLFDREKRIVSAVAGVSFHIRAGEAFGLVGESGCGKTTIGRLLVGLETPTSGAITFDGDAVVNDEQKLRLERAKVRQMIFQDPYASLNPRKQVREILAEPLSIQGYAKPQIDARLRELLGEVGLSADVLSRYPHEFSGGQRQRLGFARALAVEPRLVIADEPVSALDVSIQAQILNMMQDLRTNHNLSYLFISHDLAVVRYIADRIGVMYLGKLVEVGPSAEVFAQPAHHYTRGLLSSVPIPDVDAPLRGEHRITGEIPSPVNPPSGCRFRTRCPAADDRCANEEPTMEAVAGLGAEHLVACHHPLRATVQLRSTVAAS